jgi:hypothetical protein
MQNILSEAAMVKLLTLATEAQYRKAAAAILVVVVGGASLHLLLPRRKPAVKDKNIVRLLPVPSSLFILTFLQLPIPATNDQPPSEEQVGTSTPPSTSQALTRHIPAPINTLLTAVGPPGVDTPKITPEDKIVEKAPESYGALAPGGKGLEIHEEVEKQKVIDGVEVERLAGMKVEEKREEGGEGSPSGNQRRPSRLGRYTAGGEVVAPEPGPMVDEEVETDREDFESAGEGSTDGDSESMAGDGEDVEMEDAELPLGEFEDGYL